MPRIARLTIGIILYRHPVVRVDRGERPGSEPGRAGGLELKRPPEGVVHDVESLPMFHNASVRR